MFIQENAFDNIVSEMAAILFRPQYVNNQWTSVAYKQCRAVFPNKAYHLLQNHRLHMFKKQTDASMPKSVRKSFFLMLKIW